MTIEKQVGKYTVVYVPELGLATVAEQGLLVRVAVHDEEDPGALEKCEAWARERVEDEAA